MKIGIDASCWFNGRGFGRFTREIINALLQLKTDHRFTLFFDRECGLALDADQIVVEQSRQVTDAAVADGSRHPIDVLKFTVAVARTRPDVMFYPAVYSWFPCLPGLPNVLTLHDAIAEHYPNLVFPGIRGRALWNLKVKLARLQATRILTVSNAAREEIVRYMRVDPARIDVTTEGPKSVFQPLGSLCAEHDAREELCRQYALPSGSRYFSYVGGFAPHKNVLGLIRALATMGAHAAAPPHLLLVGDIGSHGFHSNLDDIKRTIVDYPDLGSRVHFTGFVEDDLLARIYATSLALVLPSFSEGFGLPTVEAMACGTPVLASSVGSLPEIVGDAGLLFDPLNIPQMAACLREIATDENLSRRLRERARQRASQFSWAAGARLALASIEKCSPRIRAQ